jgi:hypothetical protein
MELMIKGLKPNASAAERTAKFSAGKEPDNETATLSPSPTPASLSQVTTKAAKYGFNEVCLALKSPSVVVKSE